MWYVLLIPELQTKKKRTREGRPLLGLKKSETTSKMWSCKRVSVIPVVIWALGAVTKNLMMWVTKTRTPGILNLLQAPVVQTLDSAIHRINHYPADKYQGNQLRYPLDRFLSCGQRYPTFEQPRPGSLLVRNSKDLKKDPRHLRLQEIA